MFSETPMEPGAKTYVFLDGANKSRGRDRAGAAFKRQ